MTDLLILFGILAAVGVLGLLAMVAIVPLVLEAGALAEASSIMVDGIGEFVGRRRLVRVGCLLLALAVPMLCAACIALAVLVWR